MKGESGQHPGGVPNHAKEVCHGGGGRRQDDLQSVEDDLLYPPDSKYIQRNWKVCHSGEDGVWVVGQITKTILFWILLSSLKLIDQGKTLKC